MLTEQIKTVALLFQVSLDRLKENLAQIYYVLWFIISLINVELGNSYSYSVV